ncbi:hypothetical protein [Frankia sp. Cr1]|uniref:hypothetical protein n=1 Tax=Frankia sp. Cr1 TaxID=3073931 RepID=UPI002AD25D36|nr:hypothetical protein [Frankia sp. Cr1]
MRTAIAPRCVHCGDPVEGEVFDCGVGPEHLDCHEDMECDADADAPPVPPAVAGSTPGSDPHTLTCTVCGSQWQCGCPRLTVQRFVAVLAGAGQMHVVGPFDDRDEAAAAGDTLAEGHPDTRMHVVIELVDVTTADLLLTLAGDLRATGGAA